LKHGPAVYGISWSSDGKLLASVSVSEQSVCIWDAVKGEQLNRTRLPGPRRVAFRPHSGELAVGIWGSGRSRGWLGGLLTVKNRPELPVFCLSRIWETAPLGLALPERRFHHEQAASSFRRSREGRHPQTAPHRQGPRVRPLR